jgi:hypothetical protein
VKRLVAQELTLSFVPDAEQRLWRTVMRRKYQITRSRVQLHNRTVKRILRRWPHWPINDCGQRPSNCATPSVRARIFIRSIGGW